MADNQQLQQVNEASWDLVGSLHETNQAVAESLVTLQERNLRFAQTIFLSWLELLTRQTESVQRLQQQWGQQTRKQTDAVQKLASPVMQIYLDFFRAPFAFSRRLVDVTENMVQRGREQMR